MDARGCRYEGQSDCCRGRIRCRLQSRAAVELAARSGQLGPERCAGVVSVHHPHTWTSEAAVHTRPQEFGNKLLLPFSKVLGDGTVARRQSRSAFGNDMRTYAISSHSFAHIFVRRVVIQDLHSIARTDLQGLNLHFYGQSTITFDGTTYSGDSTYRKRTSKEDRSICKLKRRGRWRTTLTRGIHSN